MTETVVALLLFLNGNMIEHVYKDDIASCEKSKKAAQEHVISKNVVFICKKVKAKTEIDEYRNEKRIVKVLDENVFTASGTGFFISDEGHLITNHHVVKYCNLVQVNYRGKVSKAKILARDRTNDLSLLETDIKLICWF